MDNNYLIERYLINLTEGQNIRDNIVAQNEDLYRTKYSELTSHCPSSLKLSYKQRLISSVCKLEAKIKTIQMCISHAKSSLSRCKLDNNPTKCVEYIKEMIHESYMHLDEVKASLRKKQIDLSHNINWMKKEDKFLNKK